MSSRTHSAKVAVGLFAGVLSIAGVAAAAAGGHLPDAAQDAVSHAASHVGLSVQDSNGKAHDGVTGTVHSDVTPPPCPNDATSHGAYVSSVAQSTTTGTAQSDTSGNHGAVVSAAAHSDCGKSGGNGPSVTGTEHSSVSDNSSTKPHKSSEGESNSEGAGPAITATEHASDSGTGDAATIHSSDGLTHRP
jgi:hypothetical protein